MAPFIFFIISIIFALSINNAAISLAGMNKCQGPTLNRTSPVMFIFGDSQFDPGNNNYFNTPIRANFSPYGETYFKFPTGRFSDGRLIPDFIAEYAELPLIPPFLQSGIEDWYQEGVNFASSGSGALVETGQGLEGKTACCGTGLYRGNVSCGQSFYQLCPNPNSYLYWDSVHKTERAYEQMAYQWWNEAGIGPYSLKTLFHCL